MLKNRLTFKKRQELEAKMAEILEEDIGMLSTELQRILVDDLVTAFQNRVNVLIRAQERGNY